MLFSCSVVSSWLGHHGLHGFVCPSPSPRVCSTHGRWVSVAVQPSHPLLPPLLLPSIFPSTRVFSNESALHIRWPKYWSFSFSISLSIIKYKILFFFFLSLFFRKRAILLLLTWAYCSSLNLWTCLLPNIYLLIWGNNFLENI